MGDAIKFCILEFQERTWSVGREKENRNDGGKQEKLSLKGQDSWKEAANCSQMKALWKHLYK